MAAQCVGTTSLRRNEGHVVIRERGYGPARVSSRFTWCVMLPVTWRHHHRVDTASSAEIMAIRVKGSAELMVKSTPETLALMARAAVLEVAKRPWRRLSSRSAAPWVSSDAIDGT